MGSCSRGHLTVARVRLKKAVEGYRNGCHSSMNPCAGSRQDIARGRVELAKAPVGCPGRHELAMTGAGGRG